ncbi:MAG: hypothetical protein ABI990_12300 [Actinomycetota bacterium]
MLLALLFLPALVAIALLTFRWRRAAPVRVLAEAVPPPATKSGDVDPVAALDALLAELESATVQIGGAEELDDSDVVVLERLADKLEAAAASLERVA